MSAIDIQTLPVDQVARILKQLEEEVQLLSESLGQLQMARNKYLDGAETLQHVQPANKDKEIFMPLTSSLYVKGTLSNTDTVLVDIGTGYYVEKTIKETFEYTARKIKDIDSKAASLKTVLESKQNSLVQVQMVYQAKVAQIK